MSMNLVTLLYLIASVCFIQALKGLSHPTTSIRGNVFGMTGMAIAVFTTAALIWKLAGAGGDAAMGMGWVIFGLLGFKLLLDARRQDFLALTEHKGFAWTMGLGAGVTTMLANAAGPVMTVYLLSQSMLKKDHLGVFSRFFLFINLFKVPFSADLGIINAKSLSTNLVLLPAVVVGIATGWVILRKIPQKPFEWTLFGLTLVAAAWLIHG